MYVTKYNPMREIKEFQRGFDSFNSFLDNFISKSSVISRTNFEPLVNTREGEHAYHLELDLPGMKKEDINVDVKDNVVTISGERKTKEEIEKEDYYRIESSYGKFERIFTLPENVDVENIHAESQDGVLEVIIPKLEKVEKQPKKIEIR
jgi:HSP20 family protein